MTEATQSASKKIIGAPMMLYKLTAVSDTNTLTTSFGKVRAAFISTFDPDESGSPTYVSYTSSGAVITFQTIAEIDLDVLVWGE